LRKRYAPSRRCLPSTEAQNKVSEILPALLVIPAEAGIQTWSENLWTPASAGVTAQLMGHYIEWNGARSETD
jgi:hypothetical protein